MKKLLIVLSMLMVTSWAFATEVELYQYSNRNNPSDLQGLSVYNFKTKSRGDEFNYSEQLMYNGTNVDDAYFEGQMVTDQFSTITDLGKMSCKSIVSKYPEYKHTMPTSWLTYANNNEIADEYVSRLDIRLGENRFVRAPALKGHCYFVHYNDSESQVMGIFHVKEIKDVSVIIDEMETLLVRKL